MSHKFSEREIRDEIANKLNRAMMQPEGNELPEEVRDAYWRMKAACDRLNCPPDDRLLVMVILIAGSLPAPEAPTFLSMVRNGNIQEGTFIGVKYRGKSRSAKFVALAGGGTRVRLDMDGDEREVPVANCSINVEELATT